MKTIVFVLLCGFSVLLFAKELDLKLFQYPVEDAQRSAKSTYPTFAGYIWNDRKDRRVPGLDAAQLEVVNKKYRVKVMNKYRLYAQDEMDIEEKILLERYCTRYNRQLAISLGL